MRRMALLAGLLVLALLQARPARAEYRAYQLQVVDLYDCRVAKMKTCPTQQVTTAFGPRQYVATHGGSFHIGVVMMATWMCYGDTSDYKAVCPRPPAHKPKFKVGETVVVTLSKHITQGWQGKVEVAYYQPLLHANVYGVRFADRRGVYARYYEKDLQAVTASANASAQAGGHSGAGRTASATASAAAGRALSADAAASRAGAALAGSTAGAPGETTPRAPQAIFNGLTAQPTTTVSPSPMGQPPGSGGIAAAGPPPLSVPPQ